jgi:hypothetical protein
MALLQVVEYMSFFRIGNKEMALLHGLKAMQMQSKTLKLATQF